MRVLLVPEESSKKGVLSGLPHVVNLGMLWRCGGRTCGKLLMITLMLCACERSGNDGATTISLGAMQRQVGGSETILALTQQRRRGALRQSGSVKRLQTVSEATEERSDPFRSPEDCLALLRGGERAIRDPGTARLASWNVRWFPDGVPGNSSGTSHATDVDWMACTIAWMNVDVIAFAEIKSKPRSEVAVARLTQRLDELTNGRHVFRMDDCPDQNGQHVAFLLNEQRVKASDWQIHPAINPNGDACTGQLRPGLGVRLKFVGGLDLHAIVVHLKSGTESRDIDLRRKSVDALERITASVTRLSNDADLVVAGDFNTMGCRACAEVQRSAAEASWLDARLRAFHPEMRRIPSDLGCSHYYQRQPSLLDHFLVTKATEEAGVETRAMVMGHCRELGCEGFSGKEPNAMTQLSDHCPIVMALDDRDLDAM